MNPDIASTSIVQYDKVVSAYNMPPSLDHTKETQPLGQVSTIKGFLQSFVRLLSDPSSVKVLQNMIERCGIEVEGNLDRKQLIICIQEGEKIGNLD
jgi:hypothetical protein